ncbi:hypothetical protein [Neisseria gonorrhoeae]
MSAPTNRLPNKPAAKPSCGETEPITMPNAKPAAICLTRLTRPIA